MKGALLGSLVFMDMADRSPPLLGSQMPLANPQMRLANSQTASANIPGHDVYLGSLGDIGASLHVDREHVQQTLSVYLFTFDFMTLFCGPLATCFPDGHSRDLSCSAVLFRRLGQRGLDVLRRKSLMEPNRP